MCISAWLNLSALFENNPSAWMFWIIVLLTDWADRCSGVSFSEKTAKIALISFGSVFVLCFMIAIIKWKGLFKAKCKFLFYIKGYYNNNNINTYILFYCLYNIPDLALMISQLGLVTLYFQLLFNCWPWVYRFKNTPFCLCALLVALQTDSGLVCRTWILQANSKLLCAIVLSSMSES